jgi:hypothetical protein
VSHTSKAYKGVEPWLLYPDFSGSLEAAAERLKQMAFIRPYQPADAEGAMHIVSAGGRLKVKSENEPRT